MRHALGWLAVLMALLGTGQATAQPAPCGVALLAEGGVWVLAPDGSAPHLVPATDDVRQVLGWLPDGALLATTEPPQPGAPQRRGVSVALQRLDVATGARTHLGVVPSRSQTTSALAPDGHTLALAEFIGNQVTLMDTATGTTRLLSNDVSTLSGWLFWMPDSVTLGISRATLDLVNTRTGAGRKLVQLPYWPIDYPSVSYPQPSPDGRFIAMSFITGVPSGGHGGGDGRNALLIFDVATGEVVYTKENALRFAWLGPQSLLLALADDTLTHTQLVQVDIATGTRTPRGVVEAGTWWLAVAPASNVALLLHSTNAPGNESFLWLDLKTGAQSAIGLRATLSQSQQRVAWRSCA